VIFNQFDEIRWFSLTSDRTMFNYHVVCLDETRTIYVSYGLTVQWHCALLMLCILEDVDH